MLRKISVLFVSVAMMVGLTACANTNDNSSEWDTSDRSSQTENNPPKVNPRSCPRAVSMKALPNQYRWKAGKTVSVFFRSRND